MGTGVGGESVGGVVGSDVGALVGGGGAVDVGVDGDEQAARKVSKKKIEHRHLRLRAVQVKCRVDVFSRIVLNLSVIIWFICAIHVSF
jgi:hypothetical protein